MKKSLVITTIATVLVIVVALTTATFAWFSSAGQTQATSSFTAQTNNAAFTLVPWSSGNGNGTFDTGNGSAIIDLTSASTIDNNAGRFGLWTTTDMKPYMPTSVINAASPKEVTGNNWGGIPGADFFTAASTGNDKVVSQVTAVKYANDSASTIGFPNVAKLQLFNHKAVEQQVQIEVSITSSEARGALLANALRFLIIGVPNDTSNSASFVFGTQYEYSISGSTNGGTGSLYTPTDTPTDLTDVSYPGTATNTDYGTIGLADLHNIKEQNQPTETIYTMSDTEGKVKLAASKAYTLYIYVWMNGSTATESLGGGQVNFEINFTAPEAEESP